MLTPGRVIFTLATVVNISLAVLVAIVVMHAKTGTLQAQEDFDLFLLIIPISGITGVACAVTLAVGGLLRISSDSQRDAHPRTTLAVLGGLNCVAPFALVFALKWLVRG
jgi:hypothetical protein